jgi:hypothetical protein
MRGFGGQIWRARLPILARTSSVRKPPRADGHVVLKLWFKDGSGTIEQAARYAVAVTIEAD